MRNLKLLFLLCIFAILHSFVFDKCAGFSRVDSNHDSYLTPDEFFAFFQASRPYLSPESISVLVNDIFSRDLDKDGRLSPAERSAFGDVYSYQPAQPMTHSSSLRAPFSPLPLQPTASPRFQPIISHPPQQHDLHTEKHNNNNSSDNSSDNNNQSNPTPSQPATPPPGDFPFASLPDHPSTRIMKVQTSNLVANIVPSLLPLTPGPSTLLPEETLAILSASGDKMVAEDNHEDPENEESEESTDNEVVSMTYSIHPLDDYNPIKSQAKTEKYPMHPINNVINIETAQVQSKELPVAERAMDDQPQIDSIAEFIEVSEQIDDHGKPFSNLSNRMKILYVITRDLDMAKFNIKIPYSDLRRTHLDEYCNLQRNRKHFFDSCVDLENLARGRPVSTLPPPEDPVQYTSSTPFQVTNRV